MLLDEASKYKYRGLLSSPVSYIVRKRTRKEIHLLAKKRNVCPNCQSVNGVVKKGPGVMKIIHDQYRNCPKKRKEEAINQLTGMFTVLTTQYESNNWLVLFQRNGCYCCLSARVRLRRRRPDVSLRPP